MTHKTRAPATEKAKQFTSCDQGIEGIKIKNCPINIIPAIVSYESTKVQSDPACITQGNGRMCASEDNIQSALDSLDELCMEERGIYETTPCLYFLSPPP